MQGCVTLVLLLALAVFVMVTLIRWFEQTAEAVDGRQWDRLTLLVLMPFAVWLYPSRVGAGRPMAVPRHEPVRGFGTVPLNRPTSLEPSANPPGHADEDSPPPGTPAEFLGPPKVPIAKPVKKPVDPEKLARMKQKLREQGMLPDVESD